MSFRYYLPELAFGLLLFGPCAAAWSQTTRPCSDGTGVEPRYLKPCGRLISISDRDASCGCTVRVACAPAPRCAAVPSCAAPTCGARSSCAAPSCAASCCARPSCAAPCVVPECSCIGCQMRIAGAVRTALDWVAQQILDCPTGGCEQPSCGTARSCDARPGCGIPHLLLRPREVEVPSSEENPFRDDSVQTPLPPQAAKPAPARNSVAVQRNVTQDHTRKPISSPPRSETFKSRVAFAGPSLSAAD
jgi:hypothetical protein